MVGSGPHQAGSHQPESADPNNRITFPTLSVIKMKRMKGFEREVCTPLKLAKAILVWVVMCSRDKITTGPCNQKKLGVMYPRDRMISRPCSEK